MVEKKVRMIVLNSVKRDSRVKREALTIKSFGYDIEIYGLKENKEDKIVGDYLGIRIYLINLFTKNILPKNPIGWFIKYLEFILKITFKLCLEKVDIIHAHDLDALFPGYIISKIKKTKIIYDSHELFTETSDVKKKQINKLWSKIEKYLIVRVNKVIAANESRAEIMVNEFGAKELPTVILNIPDRDSQISITNSKDLKTFLRELGYHNKKIVLYQGGITKRRNIDKLILSVKNWSKELILILMGTITKKEKESFIQIINTNNLNDRVFFHPFVNNDNLLNYTMSADIGIVIYNNISRNDYYCAPNKLFEYASVNLPVVGSNFPEIKKIVSNYQIGELFDPNNTSEIAKAINNVADNLGFYKKKMHFEKLFSDINWKTQQEKLKQIYLNL